MFIYYSTFLFFEGSEGKIDFIFALGSFHFVFLRFFLLFVLFIDLFLIEVKIIVPMIRIHFRPE